MIEVQYIQKGTVYRIRNRKTNCCLTAGPEIHMSPFQNNKISQLWLFDEAKPILYHIINMQTGQLLSRKESGLVLEKGNWLIDQFWKLQRAEMSMNENYFWIISNEDENQYLFASSLSTKTSLRNFDITLFVSNWEMIPVDLDKELPGCCIFKSEFSGMVIDVPEASNKDGIGIIQYSLNGHGNQRWVLEKVIDSYVIRNLCSNMILCPHNKTVKPNTKIIQSQFSNKSEQKWIFERADEANKFTIKNSADNTMFLGVSSNKQSSNIILTTEKEKGIWILQGSYSMLSQR